MSRLKCLNGFVLLNCILLAQVNADDSQLNQVERIVVSGTRTAKLLSDSPVSVQLVDIESLAQVSQGTLAEALNYIPGLVVTRNQKDGYTIQMQGYDSDNVLILLNSQPLIAPTGSAVDLDQLGLANIKHIEILRGTAAVLYGSAAMGGVINIITKDQADINTRISFQLSHYTNNQIEGEPPEHQVRFNTGTQLSQWHLASNLTYISNPGFDYNEQTVAQSAIGADKMFADLTLSGQLKEVRTSLKYRYFTEDKQKALSRIPGQSDGFLYYQSDVSQHQFDTLFSSRSGTEPWKISSRLMQHQETSGQTGSLRKTEILLAELDGQTVWQGKKWEFVSGGVVHFDGLDQIKVGVSETAEPEIASKTRNSVESFGQLNWIEKNWQLMGGIRAQKDSGFGWHSAASLSGLIKQTLDELQLEWRADIGQGYRVPNLKERFYRFDHRNLGYMVLGNEALQPEVSNAVNATFTMRQSIWDKAADLEVEVHTHFSKIDDLIESQYDADSTAAVDYAYEISRYQNIESADISGLDVSTQISLTDWRYQLNYSYLEAVDETGTRLSNRPRHQIKSNLAYSLSQYDIELLLYWLYQADEAVSVDFTEVANNHWSSWNFNFTQQLTSQLGWRMGVENLFDTHLDESRVSAGAFDARPTSSRRIYVGANYQF